MLEIKVVDDLDIDPSSNGKKLARLARNDSSILSGSTIAASPNGRAPVLHAVDHSSILWVATNFCCAAVLRSSRE